MRATNAPSRAQDNTRGAHMKKRLRCDGRVCGSRTQDNTKEEIYEEQDEMRTGHKGQNKRKRKTKSEKQETLCEAEHRKTKKKKQTQNHDQQECKRHRETDTLRADAGKKVRNTVEPQ